MLVDSKIRVARPISNRHRSVMPNAANAFQSTSRRPATVLSGQSEWLWPNGKSKSTSVPLAPICASAFNNRNAAMSGSTRALAAAGDSLFRQGERVLESLSC